MKRKFDGFFEGLFMLFMAGLILTAIVLMGYLLVHSVGALLGGI